MQQVFIETAHRKSKGVLILRTFSRHNQKSDTTAQLYCTLSMYVTPKTISHQNQKTNTTPQLYCTLSTSEVVLCPILYCMYSKYVCNTKNYFPPEPNNKHNATTILYSKYLINTKTYFPPEPNN